MVEMEEIEVVTVADLPDSRIIKITITDLLLSREGMAVVAKVEDPEMTSIMRKIPTMPKVQTSAAEKRLRLWWTAAYWWWPARRKI